MKKTTFCIICIVIIALLICSCSRSVQPINSNELTQSTVVSDISEESLTSEGGERMIPVVFYKEDKYKGDTNSNIKCDDFEATLKAYHEDFYSKKFEISHEWDTPAKIYAPFSKAIEKSDAENRLELKSINVMGNLALYRYTYDGKGCLDFMIDYPNDDFMQSRKKRLSNVKVENHFTVPAEATGIEPVPGTDYTYHLYNKVGDSILEYCYSGAEKNTFTVEFIFDDWICTIYCQSPYEADMPYFLFDEKQVTQFLENLREVADNETVDYAKLYGV